MPQPPPTSHPPVIDLFAGVGGLSLGAARAGFRIALAVEKDPKAFLAHSRNFPGSRHSQEDISNLAGESLLRLVGLEHGQLCGLIGGPPCQGFSTIGRRDVGDGRNLLFRKFFDLVRETRPLFYLAENVPGIMNDCYQHIREEATATLPGYVVLDPFLVRASDYGVPTTRTRVLFFGYRPEAFARIERDHFFAGAAFGKVCVRDALKGLPAVIRPTWNTDEAGWRKVRRDIEGEFGRRAHGMVPEGIGDVATLKLWRDKRLTSGCIATSHDWKTVRRFAELSPGEADKVSRGIRLDPNGLCPTIRAGTDSSRGSYQAVRPIHPTEPRVITPREAARLQGFPDWFRFDPTKWHSFRQIGNSVSPILAERILSVVRRKLACEPTADSSRSAA